MVDAAPSTFLGFDKKPKECQPRPPGTSHPTAEENMLPARKLTSSILACATFTTKRNYDFAATVTLIFQELEKQAFGRISMSQDQNQEGPWFCGSFEDQG